MFTGLIKTIGTLRRRGEALVVEGCVPFPSLILGDSVSVDGVCLTVTGLVPDGFLADASEETLKRTTLGAKSKKGGFVNLEPALALSDRLGGHLVSGHVDGLGEVVALEALKNSWEITIRWQNPGFGRYICEKASISLNGISLTIANCEGSGELFSISVIPHTWGSTSLKYLAIGELVNLEADLMAKYVESLLCGVSQSPKTFLREPSFELSKDWLESQGWK